MINEELLRKNYAFLRQFFVAVGEIRQSGSIEIDEIHLVLCLVFAAGADSLSSPDANRPAGLSAHTISQMTEMPRETVRRKMQKLLAGEVVSQEAGRHYVLKFESPVVQSILTSLAKLAP
jgi:hypothetical protein